MSGLIVGEKEHNKPFMEWEFYISVQFSTLVGGKRNDSYCIIQKIQFSLDNHDYIPERDQINVRILDI